MYLRSSAAALLAVCALGLAACSGDGDGAAASPSSASERRQAALKFAQCMREQGIDFPDPKPGGGPTPIRSEGPPEKMREAEQACKKFREEIKPPDLSDAEKKEFKDAALAHARCMREQGIDFPDPTFSENGGAEVRIGKGGVEPDEARFKEAEEKCSDKLSAIRERQP